MRFQPNFPIEPVLIFFIFCWLIIQFVVNEYGVDSTKWRRRIGDNKINARAKAFKTSQFIHLTYAWRFHCTVWVWWFLFDIFSTLWCALIHVFRLKVLLRFCVVKSSIPLSPSFSLLSAGAWIAQQNFPFDKLWWYFSMLQHGLGCTPDHLKSSTSRMHTNVYICCLMNFTFRWPFDVSLLPPPPPPPPSPSLAHRFNFTLF